MLEMTSSVKQPTDELKQQQEDAFAKLMQFGAHISKLQSEVNDLESKKQQLEEKKSNLQSKQEENREKFKAKINEYRRNIEAVYKPMIEQMHSRGVREIKSNVLQNLGESKHRWPDGEPSGNKQFRAIDQMFHVSNRGYIKDCCLFERQIRAYLEGVGRWPSSAEEQAQVKESLAAILSRPVFDFQSQAQLDQIRSTCKLTDGSIFGGQKQHLEALLKAIVSSRLKSPKDRVEHIDNAIKKQGGRFQRDYFNEGQMQALCDPSLRLPDGHNLYLNNGFRNQLTGMGIIPSPVLMSELQQMCSSEIDWDIEGWLGRLEKCKIGNEDHVNWNTKKSKIKAWLKTNVDQYKLLSSIATSPEFLEHKQTWKKLRVGGLEHLNAEENRFFTFLESQGDILETIQDRTAFKKLVYDWSEHEAQQSLDHCLDTFKDGNGKEKTEVTSFLRSDDRVLTFKGDNDLALDKWVLDELPAKKRNAKDIASRVHRARTILAKIQQKRRLSVATIPSDNNILMEGSTVGRRIELLRRDLGSLQQEAKQLCVNTEDDFDTQEATKSLETIKTRNEKLKKSLPKSSEEKSSEAKLSVDLLPDSGGGQGIQLSEVKSSDAPSAPATVQTLDLCLSNARSALEKHEASHTKIQGLKTELVQVTAECDAKREVLEKFGNTLKQAMQRASQNYKTQKRKSKNPFRYWRGHSGANRNKDLTEALSAVQDPVEVMKIVKGELAKAAKSKGWFFKGDSAMRKGSFNRYLVIEVARVASLIEPNEMAKVFGPVHESKGESKPSEAADEKFKSPDVRQTADRREVQKVVDQYSAEQYRALAGELHKIFRGFEETASISSPNRPESLNLAQPVKRPESLDLAQSPDIPKSSGPSKSGGG